MKPPIPFISPVIVRIAHAQPVDVYVDFSSPPFISEMKYTAIGLFLGSSHELLLSFVSTKALGLPYDFIKLSSQFLWHSRLKSKKPAQPDVGFSFLDVRAISA